MLGGNSPHLGVNCTPVTSVCPPSLSRSLSGQILWPSEYGMDDGAGGTRGGDPPYLHGDIDRLHWHTVQVLIATAASAAQQGDTGWAEHMLHLTGVL